MKLCLLVLFLFCFSCASNVSKNKVTTSILSMGEIFPGNQNRGQQFIFQRNSWFQELTMLYDFWYGEIAPSSPFFNLSSEGESYRQCQKVFLGLHYSLNMSKIPHSLVIAQLELAGWQLRKDHGMESYLKLHPDYETYSWALYDPYIYCYRPTNRVSAQSTSSSMGVITIPQFSPLNLSPR